MNHGTHAGWFGEGMAAATITQRIRHIFGPDAVAFSINGTSSPLVGTEFEKGGIIFKRGPNAPYAKELNGAAAVLGLPTLSGEISITSLYNSGKASQLTLDSFTGSYIELDLGVDVGISVGGHASYSSIADGTYTIGFGANYGIGWSPLYGIDANIQLGTTGTDSNPFKN